jgi:hypothetical protein
MASPSHQMLWNTRCWQGVVIQDHNLTWSSHFRKVHLKPPNDWVWPGNIRWVCHECRGAYLGGVRWLGVCQVVVSGVVAISNKSELLTWTSDLEVSYHLGNPRVSSLSNSRCHLPLLSSKVHWKSQFLTNHNFWLRLWIIKCLTISEIPVSSLRNGRCHLPSSSSEVIIVFLSLSEISIF